MGCTSSTPNMADTHTNTGSTGDQNEEVKNEVRENQNKIEHLNNDSALKEVKLVLPSCDNLQKNLHLASNNNSSENICNLEENRVKEINVQNENEVTTTTTANNEKYTTLKEVVDKVLLDKTLENEEKVLGPYILDEKEPTIIEDCVVEDIIMPDVYVDNEKTTEEIPQQEEESNGAEEAASPSQSDCSRATRWEALADIAAELPPSLAMDPLTGQIYSLAK